MLEVFQALEAKDGSPIEQNDKHLKSWRKEVKWINEPGLHIGDEGGEIILVVQIMYVLFPVQVLWNSWLSFLGPWMLLVQIRVIYLLLCPQ